MHRPLSFLIFFFLLSALVKADYGREDPDLAPRPPRTLPNPESIHNDASVPADEEALRKIETERQQLAKKLTEIEDLKLRISTKHELLQRVQKLRAAISEKVHDEQLVKKQETDAERSFQLSVQRKNATWDQRETIAQERKKLETLLQQLKHEGSSFEAEYAKTEAERKSTGTQVHQLTQERERLLNNVQQLVERFKRDGFHLWLERNLDSLPLIMRETILKTSNFVDPILDRVEDAAGLNEQLTNETTEAITRYLPAIKNSPFYTGLIFYIILLIPLVAATWLVLKIRARLSLLTVEHYLIAINLYFGVLSVACAAMTILGSADILIVFRHRSLHMAETFMILHAFLFLIHLVLHGVTAYVSGVKKDFAQYICMSCVGLHFFMNAYKRTIFDQDPTIGAPAYIVYSAIFLYTLYDRGVYILEAAVKDRKADTSAFGTYPSDQSYKLPTTATNNNGDRTVYFAGLPVYNAPTQSALDDAKTI